ncbi:hypothetical protein BH09BAC1_BH09BAC1_07350 [soil metagenome]
MTIEELKTLRESEDKVEFKEAKRNFLFNGGSHNDQADRRKCFLGYIVALANEGGGMLVLGMTDKPPRQVVGTDFAKSKTGALEDETYTKISIRIKIKELQENGKRVLVINVPPRPVGKTLKFEGVALMRVGESLRNMSDEEMFRILSEQEPDFSATICEGITINNLDTDAVKLLKEKYARKQNNEAFISLSDEQALKDLSLITNTGKITYAALILVGKKDVLKDKLPQAKTIIEYREQEAQITSDWREEVSDPLFIGIEEIWNHINHRNTKTHIQEGAYIFDVLTYNEEVIREAVLNAIAHRAYNLTSEIVIKQYPKKLVLSNPGGFPNGVTLENILTVNSTPRSRLMADVLLKTGLVERSGQGVDKIFSISLSEGKPEPDYSDSDMYHVILKLDGHVTDKAFNVFLNKYQKEHGKLSAEQIITLCQVKEGLYAKAKPRLVAELEAKGLVRKLGGHTNRYTLPDTYSQMVKDHQQIGKRYSTPELKKLLIVLQGTELSISEIENELVDTFNRNQIKFLLGKLKEDDVVSTSGKLKGTKYLLGAKYTFLRGEDLMSQVIEDLKELS